MKARPRVLYGLGAALLLVALLCLSCGGNAAETPSAETLLSMLAQIPEDPISQAEDLVYFVDYSAMESVYDATRPANAEEFTDLPPDLAHNVWWVLFRSSAWSFSQYWPDMLEDGPATVGFSPLAVDQAIQFGTPPGTGLMLTGAFDADTISAAYQANLDFAPKDFDGTTVWMWGDDAASGMLVDISNVVRGNPFGGYLGRRQPMVISDELLMSSGDLDLVLAHAGAAEGTVPNLADASGYRAAVAAVAEDADILQAAIAGPAMASSIAYPPLGNDLLSPEVSGSTGEAIPRDQTEPPPFELLILADVVTGDEQIARVGLVYGDAGSAETAGPILLDHLETYSSLAGSSFTETLTPPTGTGQRYYVHKESEVAVLVLEFPAPRATPKEIAGTLSMAGDEASITTPGFVYRRLLSMFAKRDTSWLSAATP